MHERGGGGGVVETMGGVAPVGAVGQDVHMTVRDQIQANRWRTLVVLGAFGVLIAAVMAAVAGLYDPSMAGLAGAGALIYGLVA